MKKKIFRATKKMVLSSNSNLPYFFWWGIKFISTLESENHTGWCEERHSHNFSNNLLLKTRLQKGVPVLGECKILSVGIIYLVNALLASLLFNLNFFFCSPVMFITKMSWKRNGKKMLFRLLLVESFFSLVWRRTRQLYFNLFNVSFLCF